LAINTVALGFLVFLPAAEQLRSNLQYASLVYQEPTPPHLHQRFSVTIRPMPPKFGVNIAR